MPAIIRSDSHFRAIAYESSAGRYGISVDDPCCEAATWLEWENKPAEALQHLPDLDTAVVNLLRGACHFELGQLEPACVALERALTFGENSKTRLMLGQCLLLIGAHAAALNEFRRILASDPKNVYAKGEIRKFDRRGIYNPMPQVFRHLVDPATLGPEPAMNMVSQGRQWRVLTSATTVSDACILGVSTAGFRELEYAWTQWFYAVVLVVEMLGNVVVSPFVEDS
ncbi:MAG: tetratricopeptide repeat protein, partial [Candidatus Riflebacteria bacterium]|nr:tetratricopeptide repeat protein [Candidatus Riflebacteria bacterium]